MYLLKNHCFFFVNFREKISFFTRKGLSVPELPIDFILPEADPIEEEEEEEEEDEAAEEETEGIEQNDDKMITRKIGSIEQTIGEQQNKIEETTTEIEVENSVVIDAETAIAINTALVASSLRNRNLSENHVIVTGTTTSITAGRHGICSNVASTLEIENHTEELKVAVAKKENETTGDEERQQKERYDYVVDRNYGVEV